MPKSPKPVDRDSNESSPFFFRFETNPLSLSLSLSLSVHPFCSVKNKNRLKLGRTSQEPHIQASKTPILRRVYFIFNPRTEQLIMDLDFDLDSPWPEDPNQFIPNPSSPFPTYLPPLSSSPPNHPSFFAEFCSPLWVFSDSPSTPKPTIPSSISPTISPNSGESSEIIAGKLLGNPSAEEDSDGSCMMKKRMMQALRFFKESTEQHHVLVQVWAPVKKGDRYVLTTSGQPFVLDPTCSGLLQYRTVSLKYVFSADSEGEGELGLPGRVFRKKLPEWTPNVQYYSSKEYPRLTHALHYDVRGTLALPIFEPYGQSCVGVVELILTAQKVNYAPEVDKVCKALKAVNLKSSEILDHPNMQICNEGRQEALAEILEVLTVVCEKHKLPLAQTWVPCRHRSVLADGGGSKKSCTSFDGSCMGQVCMSTTDVAFSVVDAQMWGFREACAEHHLQKDQGVAGRAFASHRSCFSRDITRFNKTEYPLVHYARMFGLTGCVAICLRSAYTGSDDYILEFFLPPNCKEDAEQKALLDSLSTTMKQCFRSLIFISGEPRGEDSLEIIIASVDDKSGLKEFNKIGYLQIEEDVLPDILDQQFVAEIDAHKNDKNMINTDGSETRISISKSENKSMKRGSERRRGKTEKSISLEVLQQYFAGSLKDAAKSLGVCPTTMKRICRQHGISRWPSRKINKVTRSICKLKRVIESVQGAEGPFTLPSITTPFPVAMGSFSWPINLVPEGQSPVVREGKSPSYRIPLNDDCEHSGSQPELVKDSRGSKTRSGSGEESTEDPTSQDSSQGNPIDAQLNNPIVPVIEERAFDINQCLVLACEVNASGRSEPEALGGILVGDSGSCKDFRVLLEDHQQAMAPPQRTVTVKASYKEDIIRFRLAITSGVVDLNEEVAKRLKLEIGTFDVKYLDDDHEWVVLACDADLLECMEISWSSGGNMIRLLVHDVVSNVGSSCESSGE